MIYINKEFSKRGILTEKFINEAKNKKDADPIILSILEKKPKDLLIIPTFNNEDIFINLK